MLCCLVGETPDQIPHIYYHLLSSGRSLLSPSLGKFQLKCLTNLPCQGCCSRYTQRISINLHESWPLLDWFMSRWVLQSKHNTVRLSGFKLGLLDIDCQFTVYVNFETSRNSKAKILEKSAKITSYFVPTLF